MSLRMAAVIAAILAGLIPASTEAIEPFVNNNQVVHEKVIGDRELNLLEQNDQQVILAKSENNSGKTKTIQTGTGYLIQIQNQQTEAEGSELAFKVRAVKLGKGSSPGARAKANARANFKAGKFSSGSTIIPGADGFVRQSQSQNPFFCRYQENAPLACKPRVKATGAFQGNGNNPPPPENSQFGASHYKGGPNPFIDKFDYNNPNHTRENIDFSNQRRMNHSYDRHAKDCFGMQQNRNKETLQKSEKNLRDFIESPETERIKGCYQYDTPAYHYKKPDQNLTVSVNATNNEYISVRNATKLQIERLEIDGSLGYDNRPPLILRLRGPK